MIIWSGFGFIGLLVPMLCIFPLLALSTNWWNGNNAERVMGFTFAVGCGLSAVALWLLGRWLNRPKKDGEENEHTFFFIPVHYWAFFWIVLGVCVTAALFLMK